MKINLPAAIRIVELAHLARRHGYRLSCDRRGNLSFKRVQSNIGLIPVRKKR